MHTLESNGNIPTFILKLWKLVGDTATNNLICWSRSGTSFSIKDQARFAKEVLPLYFKHNNMASFIRQLNMYGFRKVSNIEHGGLKSDGDEVEFYHQYFVKGQDEQLSFIKRKLSNNNNSNKSLTSIVKVDEYNDILSDVESMKGRQDSVDTMLNTMKRENEALWREVAILRQKHMKQQQIVEKLLHFLVNIVRNQVVSTGLKRKAPLMIDSSSNGNRKILKTKDGVNLPASPPGSSGPIISDITDLDENDLAASLLSDSSSNQQQQQQQISTLPINLGASNSNSNALTRASDEISLLAPNNIEEEEEVKFSPNTLTMVSLPNSLLDFDLNEVQHHTDEDPSASQLLDDHISSGLATPQITIAGSPGSIVATAGSSPSKQGLLSAFESGNNGSSTDLIVPNQATSASSALPTLSPEYLLSFNDHVEGVDAELNWLQDQLYGGGLNIDPSAIFGIFSNEDNQFVNAITAQDPSTSANLLPKAIMDASGALEARDIKVEDNGDNDLFEELDLNNIASETKDILSNVDFEIDPTSFN